jgi:hypothetical protein
MRRLISSVTMVAVAKRCIQKATLLEQQHKYAQAIDVYQRAEDR